jgi:ABC transport system ATP-binding/permease protein
MEEQEPANRLSTQSEVKPQSETKSQAEAPQPAKKKLSYLEARELASIEDRIEEAELHLAAARSKVENPAIASDAAALTDFLAELERAKATVDNLVERWAELTGQVG